MAKEKASSAGNPVLLQGIKASHNPVILTDLGGKIAFANPACERLLGYQRGELLGEHLFALYPDGARRRLRRILREATTKGFGQGELELVRRDGTRLGGQVSMTALQNGAGGSGIIVVNRDISKLMPLRMELERQSEELAVRDEILRILSRSPDFEAGLGEALERTIQIAGFHCGVISLVDRDRGILVPQVEHGIPKALRRDLHREPLRLDEDLVGPVMERGEPLIIEGLARDRRAARTVLNKSGLRTAVIVPILVQEGVIGCLFLLDQRPVELPLERLRLIQAICSQMGVALENLQLHLKERRQFSQLLFVGGIAGKASSILDLEKLLDEVAAEIQRAFNYWDVLIFFVDQERGELVRKAWAGNYHRQGPKEQRAPISSQGILAWVARHGRTALVNDVQRDPRYRAFFPQTKSELCVPLRREGRVIGGINVESIKVNGFDEADVAVLETLADQLVVAIDNAELYRQLEGRVEQRTEALRTSQERLQTLSQVAAKIQGVLNEEQIIALAMEELSPMGFRGSFWSVEDGGKAIVRRYTALPPRLVAAWRKATKADLKLLRICVAEYPHLERAIEQRKVVAIDDVEKTIAYRHFQSLPDERESFRQEFGGVVYAPLLVRGQAVWLMSAAFPEMSEADIRTVEIFAHHLSIALENARLFHDLESSYQKLQQVREGLLQAERLAAIGQLAGSISHHLRNPLGVIRNSVFYLKSKLKEREEKVAEHLELIEEEIRRADRRISDLLTLAYRGVPRPRKLQLKHLVERALAETELPPQIELATEFDSDPLVVEADPEQMMQACCNIIVNALQAMAEGGRLSIRGRQQGDEAILEFEDTGSGLSQEEVARVFEPLFTTKAQGTGLGLTICKHIVEAHGGRIDFQSREGKGTRVTVWIPKEGTGKDG